MGSWHNNASQLNALTRTRGGRADRLSASESASHQRENRHSQPADYHRYGRDRLTTSGSGVNFGSFSDSAWLGLSAGLVETADLPHCKPLRCTQMLLLKKARRKRDSVNSMASVALNRAVGCARSAEALTPARGPLGTRLNDGAIVEFRLTAWATPRASACNLESALGRLKP